MDTEHWHAATAPPPPPPRLLVRPTPRLPNPPPRQRSLGSPVLPLCLVGHPTPVPAPLVSPSLGPSRALTRVHTEDKRFGFPVLTEWAHRRSPRPGGAGGGRGVGGIRRGVPTAPQRPIRTGEGTSRHIQHSPNTPTTGLRERGNDTRRSTGRSGRQNAATRRNMRRDEWMTVQGPVKKQQPDGMSHRGGGGIRRGVPTAPQRPIRTGEGGCGPGRQDCPLKRGPRPRVVRGPPTAGAGGT